MHIILVLHMHVRHICNEFIQCTKYMVLMFVLYIVHAVYMYELVCACVHVQKCVLYVQCIIFAVYHYAYVFLMCIVLFGTQVPILPSQTSVSTLLPVVIQRPPTV